MPAADGDSAGEEENGSAGSDEDGWEDGLSDTSQLSDITASQRGKLYSLTEISDFLEKTKVRKSLSPLVLKLLLLRSSSGGIWGRRWDCS
ncbi:UNVERIFIED_CONTAM: hypothetical protein FKN15_017961 [Acipenser sinensis]